MNSANTPTLLFFDGICNLCNGFIDFVWRWDKYQNFQFASLQGQAAEANLAPELRRSLETVVVKTPQGKILLRSQAILFVFSKLPYPVKFLTLAQILPTGILDFLYRLLAKHRHRFGQRNACRIPTEVERSRFLS